MVGSWNFQTDMDSATVDSVIVDPRVRRGVEDVRSETSLTLRRHVDVLALQPGGFDRTGHFRLGTVDLRRVDVQDPSLESSGSGAQGLLFAPHVAPCEGRDLGAVAQSDAAGHLAAAGVRVGAVIEKGKRMSDVDILGDF